MLDMGGCAVRSDSRVCGMLSWVVIANRWCGIYNALNRWSFRTRNGQVRSACKPLARERGADYTL